MLEIPVTCDGPPPTISRNSTASPLPGMTPLPDGPSWSASHRMKIQAKPR
jgi:hypothetical protein